MWVARPAWPGQPFPAGPVGRGRPTQELPRSSSRCGPKPAGGSSAEAWRRVVVPKQVKLLRHHGQKLPEPHLERLVVLLVLLLQANGQVAHLASTPSP